MKDLLKRILIKLTSSKVLMTIAATVLLYIIVLGNKSEFKEIAYICAGVIPVYIGGNIVQKKFEENK